MRHVFPCGTLALDFVGTLQTRGGPAPVERIGTPVLLDSWFVQSGLLDTEPGSTECDLRAALALRESVYCLLRARLDAVPLPVRAVAAVNRRAAAPPVTTTLLASGAIRHGTAREALASLAREAVEVVTGQETALLRECAHPHCTQVYLDRSRGQRRQWCAMRTCGNRAKAAALRARRER